MYMYTINIFVDDHLKLIQQRFVTHGGIDGYSQIVVYLKCSINNKASTVYNLFLAAVKWFSLPSRVRSDQGRKNILVALHMIHHRSAERRSIIVSCSVHNQRIEQLWKDMFHCVISLYCRLFYFLEARKMLDSINEIHLYAIHLSCFSVIQ